MLKCKEMWKSIADFLINKLGGITKDEHQELLLADRQYVYMERRPVKTATLYAEAKWGHEIGLYERRYVAERVGLKLLEEGFLRFDCQTVRKGDFPPIYAVRAVVRVLPPSSQAFGYEIEGNFVEDPAFEPSYI